MSMNTKNLRGIATRILLVIRFQFLIWKMRDVPVAQKISYTATSFLAPVRGRVSYLGSSFCSDNKAALLLLPEYALLVDHVVRTMSSFGNTCSDVLDVGANVGQFAATLIRTRNSSVVSIEPNPACWPFLELNGVGLGKWTLEKRAISSHREEMELFFVRRKSAQGSFLQSNASRGLIGDPTLERVLVQSGPFLFEGDGRRFFDLVKIDVEGFELEVIRGLKGVQFDFLMVEVEESRENGFTQSELEATVLDALGMRIVEVYSDRPANEVGPRNVLYRKYAEALKE